MKFCPNCGKQLPEGASVCPFCGTAVVTSGAQTQQAAPTYTASSTSRPKIQKREILTAILLTFLTCGIYGFVWFISMIGEINRVCDDEKSSNGAVTVILLGILTCGIYTIYWWYQTGKRLHAAGNKYGVPIDDNSVLYLVFSLFGLAIVSFCLVQSDLNKLAE